MVKSAAGLFVFVFSMSIWWPSISTISSAHQLVWAGILAATASLLVACVLVLRNTNWVKNALTSRLVFFLGTLTLMLCVYASVGALRNWNEFSIQQFGVLTGSLLLLTLFVLVGLNASRSLNRGLGAILALFLVSSAVSLTADVPWLFWDGQTASVTAVFLMCLVPLVTQKAPLRWILIVALWSVPLITVSRWPALCGVAVLAIGVLLSPRRVLGLVVISGALVAFILWWESPWVGQINNQEGSKIEVVTAQAAEVAEQSQPRGASCLRLTSRGQIFDFCSPLPIPDFVQGGISSTGRTEFWTDTLAGIRMNPIFGSGIGSASEQVQIYSEPFIAPHSEPLRIVHDYGIVGFLGALAFIATVMAGLLVGGARQIAADSRRTSAALAIVSLVLLGGADNFLTFPWIMAPAAAVIGAGLRPGLLMSIERRQVSVGAEELARNDC